MSDEEKAREWAEIKVGDKIAIVDAWAFPLLSRFTWSIAGPRSRCYPYTKIVIGKKRITICMHRLLMAFPKEVVDHINRNPLDNRLVNLRKATLSLNSANRIYPPNKWGYRGVKRKHGAFYGQVSYQNKFYESKRCATTEEAAKEYDKLAVKMFGEHAVLNFPRALPLPPPPKEKV